MNIFLYYEAKFLKCLYDLEKDKKILLPDSFKKIGDAAGLKLFVQLETFILKQLILILMVFEE